MLTITFTQIGNQLDKDTIDSLARFELYDPLENGDFNILDIKFALWVSNQLIKLLTQGQSGLEMLFVHDGVTKLQFSLQLR
jgi:hypothetical protein